MRGVLRFLLGVDCDEPPLPLPVTVRQSAAPLRQDVTNYDELREAFKHHPLLCRCFEEETDGERAVLKFIGGAIVCCTCIGVRAPASSPASCQPRLP